MNRGAWIARLALCAVAVVCSHSAFGQDGLKPGDFVAVCGDSITEQRRYSNFIESYLMMCQPESDLRAMCFGWNGETSWGFAKRVENDAVSFNPSVVTICLGMNDGSESYPEADRYEDYRNAMDRIVQVFKAGGVRNIIVGTPGAVDFDTYKKGDPAKRNAVLGKLGGIAKEVAAENGVGFADVHTPMMETMKKAKERYGSSYHVAGVDGVHPESNGHIIMAYAFLKAMGCKGDIGTITYDMKAGQADGSDGHKVLSADGSKLVIESTKYPFCFSGEPSDPLGTRGTAELIPFNQDLNRFQLVVKNAPAPLVKVTWGSASKQFSAEALAAGINLAAEFGDNPFSASFARINSAIRDKEAFDIRAVKSMQHSLLDWKEVVPEFAEQYKIMTHRVADREKRESKKIREMIVPVKHTLVIEPVG